MNRTPEQVAKAPEETLTVSLLGVPSWRLSGRDPQPLWAGDAALLALLALDGPQSSASLRALLWPQATAKQSGSNLRQRLKRLRDATSDPLVTSGRIVGLHPGLRVDVCTLQTDPLDVLMGHGELLATQDFSHTELDSWVHEARRRARAELAGALHAHAGQLDSIGDHVHAAPVFERVVALMPTLEAAWRGLIRTHYLMGDRVAALGAYRRLATVLHDELGTTPQAETQQLLKTIEAADHPRQTPVRSLPACLLKPPMMVGRESAMSELERAWQEGQPFLVWADAGLGKSRLLDEFCAGRDGLLLDKARGGDEQQPYGVLTRLLREVRRRFALPEAGLEAALLASCSSASGEVVGLWRGTEALLAQAVAAGLSAVVIDDLHLADAATVETLRWLSSSASLQQLRLGMATRPLSTGRLAQLVKRWLDDSHRPRKVILPLLTHAEVEQLLASLALPAPPAQELASRLHRHAGGHVLFTLSTLQAAFAPGREVDLRRLPRPPSVQALIDERLRSLAPDCLPLLHVAAVAGADLDADRAAALLATTPVALAGPWAALEDAQVLAGERFVHDLVHEVALQRVPIGIRAALHRRMASLLEADPTATAAAIAEHWRAGDRPHKAGRYWLAAAASARRAARLDEQLELLERAAGCFAEAGDAEAEVDARCAALHSLQLRHGGAASIDACTTIETRARTTIQHLRCLLAHCEALLDLEQAHEACGVASAALQLCVLHPESTADALSLTSIAHAQLRHVDLARETAMAALQRAAAGDEPQQLRVARSVAYTWYALGDLAGAVELQRRALTLAEAIGDRAEAATAEGSLAALLAVIGDVPATYLHARRTGDRYDDMGLARNSTMACVNWMLRGSAAAYLGHMDHALDALQRGVDLADEESAVAARAKSRIALASVWLTLAQPDRVRAILAELPAQAPPGMLMQRALLMARANALEGLPQTRYLDELAELAQCHAHLPMVQSAWWEISFQGDPLSAVEQLRRAHERCLAGGLVGNARAMLSREMARTLELPGHAATARAAALAGALEPHVAGGLSARCYPPEVWFHAAQAFARHGEAARSAECLAAARAWLLETAAPRVPPTLRRRFLECNPVNRAVFDADR